MRVPVYEVRLIKARRPLEIAEGTIGDAERAARAIHSLIGLTDREHVVCLFVNGANGLTGAHVAAIGGQHGASVDARPLLRAALLACAGGIVLGHNHLSGDPSPSTEDLAFTASIRSSARVVGVPVIDHVIVTRDPGVYHSMVARGTFPEAVSV